jgi:ABC-type branched-subunit amino acid transport system substrate-binding protein
MPRAITHFAAAVMIGLSVAALSVTAALARPDSHTMSTATAAASPPLQIRVGLLESLTGGLSTFGPTYVKAVQLADSQVNAALKKLGLTKRISVKLVGVEDDQTSSTAGVEAANKLVSVDRANVLIGALASSVTLAVAQSVSIPKNIIEVAPGATSTALTTLKDNGLVWRTVASDALTAKATAQALTAKYGAKATVNIGVRNDAFGTGFEQAFIGDWKAGGGKIGASVEWADGQATYDTEAQKLVAGSPAAWVMIDFPETWAKVSAALVRTGQWDPKRTFTNQGLEASDLAQTVGEQATDGMTGVSPTTLGSTSERLFHEMFTSFSPKTPYDAFAANSYDAFVAPVLAAIAARSTSGPKIAGQMRRVAGPPGKAYSFTDLAGAIKAIVAGKDINYQGASGPLDFDANGDITASQFQMWQYQNGQLVNLSTFKLKP